MIGNIGFVGDQNDRITRFVDLFEQHHDFIRSGGVEVTSRFVSQNDRRVIDQRPGDGHPLALTTRKFIGVVVHPVAKSYCFQHGFCLFQAGIFADACIYQR